MEAPNPTILPYATPVAPAIKLFSIAGIVIATFFGTPMGGLVLMAINYRRMGREGLYWPTLLWGFATTAAVIVAAMLLPEGFPDTLFNLILLFIMYRIAKHLQGSEILVHQASGGGLASNWLALGIGLLTLLGVAILAFAVLVPLVMLGYLS